MSKIGITEAFSKYGAKLTNPNWSVSAWASDGSLVVSLWDHHYKKSKPGTMEFDASMDRWTGHGNTEFRRNVAEAFAKKSPIYLVIAKTLETSHVEAGRDASLIKKEFYPREELIGEIAEIVGDRVVFSFRKR